MPPKMIGKTWGRRAFGFLAVGAGVSIGTDASAAVTVPAPAQPWDAVSFDYPSPGRTLPGIAIRLPSSGAEPGAIYAACTICTHQACPIGYERQFSVVSDITGVALHNPVLFCRCHFSTFDLAQDGRVVFGPAQRRPWVFQVVEDHGSLHVASVEKGAGEVVG